MTEAPVMIEAGTSHKSFGNTPALQRGESVSVSAGEIVAR